MDFEIIAQHTKVYSGAMVGRMSEGGYVAEGKFYLFIFFCLKNKIVCCVEMFI